MSQSLKIGIGKISPHVFQIVAQVAGTLTVTYALSYLGVAGTLTGLAAGSAISAVLPTVYENALRRSRHKAALLRERQRQAHASASRSGDYEFLYKSGEPSAGPGISIPWKRISIALAVLFISSAAVVTIFEAVAGKPVSSVVNNTRGSGYTFGGGSSRSTSPPPSRSPSPAPSLTPVITPSTIPSFTSPAVTPSPTPVTPAPTLSPSTGALTPTPAITPSESASL